MTEQELIKKHPKIFRQKDLPMTHTAMCWGIECGPGWYHLIDELCDQLQHMTDNRDHPQVEFIQVKEKFGTLRIYYNQASEVQEKLIEFVERLSESICEVCGKPGNLKEDAWVKTLVKTLCDECYEDH